ncbi:hypothetical protein LOR37_03295 [Clostridium estertheticum]|uniref:hypothetical protein n=1 Tax=Clostridium estertheticum TaxID=238834 RepID=UPI0022DE1DEF|nr:hypothetical protein [Clostridium estertheticum]WBL47728.1 hypothetical protein LOR37_03295 [Clostridium estertheticum]
MNSIVKDGVPYKQEIKFCSNSTAWSRKIHNYIYILKNYITVKEQITVKIKSLLITYMRRWGYYYCVYL